MKQMMFSILCAFMFQSLAHAQVESIQGGYVVEYQENGALHLPHFTIGTSNAADTFVGDAFMGVSKIVYKGNNTYQIMNPYNSSPDAQPLCVITITRQAGGNVQFKAVAGRAPKTKYDPQGLGECAQLNGMGHKMMDLGNLQSAPEENSTTM